MNKKSRWTWFVVMSVVGPMGAGEPRTVRMELQCQVDKIPDGAGHVDFWIPVPSDGLGQTVHGVEIVHPAEGRLGSEPRFGNRMVHHRYLGPFEAGERPEANIVFTVTRTEVVVPEARSVATVEPQPVPPDLKRYLVPTRMIPIDGPVAELARSLDLSADQPIHAARTVYDHLIDAMDYNWRAKGAGRGDVRWACDSKTGDCTDYHSTFIALCRSIGIPADHEFGFPIAAGKKEGRAFFLHCWARFWVPGVGWVPVDISEADKHPELRGYNFGALSANYVRMTHGRDIVLEPPQHAEPLNMFHRPYAEVDGAPHEAVRWSARFTEIDEPVPLRAN